MDEFSSTHRSRGEQLTLPDGLVAWELTTYHGSPSDDLKHRLTVR